MRIRIRNTAEKNERKEVKIQRDAEKRQTGRGGGEGVTEQFR